MYTMFGPMFGRMDYEDAVFEIMVEKRISENTATIQNKIKEE